MKKLTEPYVIHKNDVLHLSILFVDIKSTLANSSVQFCSASCLVRVPFRYCDILLKSFFTNIMTHYPMICICFTLLMTLCVADPPLSLTLIHINDLHSKYVISFGANLQSLMMNLILGMNR